MNKHDLYFRNIFSSPSRTGELLHLAAKKNNNLAKFLETIDLNSLTEISESYSDGETSGYADLAFTVKLKPSLNLSAELLVGILLEHKSSNKDDTMKQLIRYWFQIMVRKQNHVPTVAVIVYNGKVPWKSDFKTLYPEYPEYYHQIGLPFICELVDVGEAIDSEEIQNINPTTAMALVAMKYIFTPEKYEKLFKRTLNAFLSLSEQEKEDIFRSTIVYLRENMPKKAKEVVTMNFVSIPEAYGFTSIAQAERNEGIKEGIKEGRREEKLEMAKAMLQGGKLSYTDIAAYSGLSVEEIKQL